MKKLFLLVLLLGVFSIMQKSVSAQNKVKKMEFTYDASFYIPCTDETVSGPVTLYFKVFKDWYQARTKGVLTGSDGTEYTLNWIQNSSFSWDKLVSTMVFNDESGETAFKVHMTYQVKYNANGELTAEVDHMSVECF